MQRLFALPSLHGMLVFWIFFEMAAQIKCKEPSREAWYRGALAEQPTSDRCSSGTSKAVVIAMMMRAGAKVKMLVLVSCAGA